MMNRVLAAFLATTALLLTGLSGGNPPEKAITIPFNEKDKSQKYLTFDVEINGKSMNALYDTGAVVAARLLKNSAERNGIPIEGGGYDIKIGDILLKGMPIRCVDRFKTNYCKDIILGQGVIKNLYAVIDFPTNRALFIPCSKETSYAEADKRAKELFGDVLREVAIPLVSPEGHILVAASLPGKEKLHFAVDTGWLGYSFLTSEATRRWGITGQMVRLDLVMEGETFKQTLFKNKSDASMEREVLNFRKHGLNFGGILGVPDFLGLYRIGIDYKEMKMHVGFPKKEEAGKAK